jgi:hypothetical protein
MPRTVANPRVFSAHVFIRLDLSQVFVRIIKFRFILAATRKIYNLSSRKGRLQMYT